MDKNTVDNQGFLNKLIPKHNPTIVEEKTEEEIQTLNFKDKKKKEKTLREDLISTLLSEKSESRRLQVMSYIRPEIHSKIEDIAVKSRSSISKVIEKILEETLK